MYNISIKNFLPPPLVAGLVAGVARSWQSTIPEKTLVRVMGWGSSPCWRSQQPPSSPRSTTPSPILKVYIYILCLQWWPWFLTLKSPNIKKLLDLLDLDSLQSYGLAVDMKVQLILVGKQSAADKHACLFGECHSKYDCQSSTLGKAYMEVQKLFQQLMTICLMITLKQKLAVAK